jgi:DNA-binding CsgD family transcriptional regulator
MLFRGADGPLELIGRVQEQATVEGLIQQARQGLSSVLVIRGEAGIGKTALIEHATSSSPDLVSTRVIGFEAEVQLGFAGLHRLLAPWSSGMANLPKPQRAALAAAFGEVGDTAPDRFLVGLAALTLLADAASGHGPVICVVDDAQWLDQASLEVMAFVGRRLCAESIVLFFGVRDIPEPPAALAGFPELRLSGLDELAAAELLTSLGAAMLDEGAVKRIVAESGGNPLAIVELAKALTSEQLAMEGFLPAVLPLDRQLEQHFLRQITRLPVGAQRLLLLAAADATGDSALLWRAAKALSLNVDDAAAAEAANLLRLRPTVAFRHPLIRSSVYRAADPIERRRSHAALADATDLHRDPDRRAWHRAEASVEPDEGVAVELEQSGGRARNTGTYAAESRFLTLAAELSPDPAARGRRLLSAAEAALKAGGRQQARKLLSQATPDLEGTILQARALRLDAALQAEAVPGDVPAILIGAARALRPLDDQLTKETLIEALAATLVSSQLTKGTSQVEIAREALASVAEHGDGTITDLMLETFATRMIDGFEKAVPLLRAAIDELLEHDLSATGLLRWSVLGTNLACDLWDIDGLRDFQRQMERTDRDRGDLNHLRATLGGTAQYEMWVGNLALAEALHDEASQIAIALGEFPEGDILNVSVYAWQGREERTREIVAVATGEFCEAIGAGVAVNLALAGLATLEISLGRYGEALAPAKRLFDDDQLPFGNNILPLVVEAAARSGDEELAGKALCRLASRAEAAGTAWSLGLLSRCRALATNSAEAEEHYRDAIENLEQTPVATDIAWTHLLFGEWLRRQNRRLEARESLRLAYNMFTAMGAQAFANRAAVELRATGGHARKRSGELRNSLTPQEEQIARMAAQHATNSEIAAQLFISANTVDYHLRKVYRKLSISSRRELATAIGKSGR